LELRKEYENALEIELKREEFRGRKALDQNEKVYREYGITWKSLRKGRTPADKALF
jgi:hypothetical protein